MLFTWVIAAALRYVSSVNTAIGSALYTDTFPLSFPELRNSNV